MGQPAPPFELVTSDGSRINESTNLGRFVVLDLMATWCGPCQLEIAHLQAVQAAYGERVVIVSIGVDPTSDSAADLDKFARDHGASWPHGVDYNGSIGRAYHLDIIPKLVILDPTGRVVLEREGEVLPAAIAGVVAPAGALPSGSSLVTTALSVGLAGLAGCLAILNPYRRYHRDRHGAAPTWIALGVFAVMGTAGWLLGGLVSTRATYGSLVGALVTLGSVVWWFRVRQNAPQPPAGGPALETYDRAYEAAPHFALALVLGLSTTGALAYATVILGFLLGFASGTMLRRKLPEKATITPGLVGLTLVGVGLLVFGSRILVAEGII